ncbi:acyltransferase [Pseudomonas aeruginosa]|nr:acyltransferase [Pseudomonas aeruginosa]
MSNTELFVNSILQILLLQAWNPYYLTFNAPLWSLSTLMFFYLAFPFVAPRLMRSRHKWKVLAAGLAGLSGSAGAGGGQRELRDSLDRPAAPQSAAAPAGIPRRHPRLRVVPRLPRPWPGARARSSRRVGGACSGSLPGGRLSVHPGCQALVLPAAQRPAAAGTVAAGVRSARCPPTRRSASSATGRRAWAPPPLSLFALHVPMVHLFSRGERLIAVPGRCLERLARLYRGGGRAGRRRCSITRCSWCCWWRSACCSRSAAWCRCASGWCAA